MAVSGYMKAQNALLKENCHHEKDEIRLCFACRNSHELRRGARTKACTQIRTDDDCTGPYETEHRKNTTTATNDERSAERSRNFAFAGCAGGFANVTRGSGRGRAHSAGVSNDA